MRSSSGCSVSRRRDGHGWKSIVPRFAAHATCATSVTQSSSACRPDGNVDARGLDPVRALRRHALLVDRLVLGAAGVALQLRRPLVERTDDALLDREVVLDVVELRHPAPEVDLVRVRDLDGRAADLELDELRGHSFMRSARRRRSRSSAVAGRRPPRAAAGATEAAARPRRAPRRTSASSRTRGS